MSLRHAVLGLLSLSPSTGYELTQRFDRSLSNAWHASHSQIYPELAKLEAEGFVEVISEGRAPQQDVGGHRRRAGRSYGAGWSTASRCARSATRPRCAGSSSSCSNRPSARRCSSASGSTSRTRREGRRQFTAEIDASGRGGAFRPVLDLAERMDAVMADWLREQRDAAKAELP